ncbi:MAG TPA: glycosyltransferase [Stellaceae bacterium]|nr:glycosyltransferase [Stellaceae bacterium]
MGSHVILDLSALVATADRPIPRGIPRVELAYAKHLLRTYPDRLRFSAFWGRLGYVPFDSGLALVAAAERQWSDADSEAAAEARRIVSRLRRGILLRGDAALYRELGSNGVYVIVSHPLLGRMRTMQQIRRRIGARFFCLVHDLIGIDNPDYVRPRQRRRHPRRMDSVAGFADVIAANSAATAEAFRRRYDGRDFGGRVVAAPLGVDVSGAVPAPPARNDSYFVCVAAIEPRKNHELLFRVWRRLGEDAPRRILVGERGWQAGRILRNRPPSFVEEYSGLPDTAVAQLLRGAHALVYPSLAEGFGLPVAEALALGVPVLCSDLPELWEVGKTGPEYLDPHDAQAWLDAVRDYADPLSSRRQAQLRRIAGWRAPTWEDHFAIVQPLLDRLAAIPSP